MDELTGDDIKKSLTRIQHAIHKTIKKESILEKETPVGQISSKDHSFYVTFRPSIGMEIFHCIDKSAHPLKLVDLKLSGKGHKGLTSLFSKKGIEEGVIKPFIEYKKQNPFPPEQYTLFVEGFSAGAHRAVETALYLKQHPKTKNHKIILLRYAGAKTFDDEALGEINSLLGRKNIIEFKGADDRIAEFLNIPGATASLGNQINFSAEDSEDYKKRVESCVYTCLDPSFKPFVSSLKLPGMSQFIQRWLSNLNLDPNVISYLTPELWENHQPLTYAELCPTAFEKFKMDSMKTPTS